MALTVSVMTGGVNNHPTTSEEANGIVTDFVSEGIVGTYTNTSGVAPATGAFAVNAQGTPDMTVAVSAGVAYVTGTPSSQNSQTFRVKSGASENVTIAANSSGSTKYDWIYIKLDATLLNAPTLAGDTTATLVTSRSTSSTADDGTPPTYGYPIAVVTVANGASSIANGSIKDVRNSSNISGEANLTITNAGAYAPQGYMVNGKITTTVASNNITVALKTLAGSNPSTSDPIYVRIGDTVRAITSALSVTKNAGTNWFNSGATGLATNEIDYFVYLGYNSTDGVVIGFSRIPFASKYGDFSTTSTSDRYCAISTITSATSTDVYENVGRFNAILSATAAFNWSIPATSIIINHPIRYTRELAMSGSFYTSITVGNGTVDCRYVINGRSAHVYASFVMGSTSSMGSSPVLNVPISGSSNYGSNSVVGNVYVEDSGVAAYFGVAKAAAGITTAEIMVQLASGTYVSQQPISSTVPFTWGTSDYFRAALTYELG